MTSTAVFGVKNLVRSPPRHASLGQGRHRGIGQPHPGRAQAVDRPRAIRLVHD
jgi:hypothetical protein